MIGKSRVCCTAKAHGFIWRAFVITGLAMLASTPALAESTTGTSLTVEGTTKTGGTIYLHPITTGSHIVYAGPGTVFGGTVDLYMDGNIIAHVPVDITNTNHTKTDPCAVVSIEGYCLADRLYGDRTEFRYPLVLPSTPGRHTFGARFAGDSTSHSSSAPDVTINAYSPAAVNSVVDSLLLD